MTELVHTDTVTETIDELEKAISKSFFSHYSRDHAEVEDTIFKYLEEDVLAAQKEAEYEKLSQAKKNRMLVDNDYGEYGHSYLVTRPEVPIALSIIAKSISPTFNIEAHFVKQLSNPEMIGTVIKRFPTITGKMIQAALA